MCICHIFLIHLSVDGHLGCFCILTVVSDVIMNIGMCVSFWITVVCLLVLFGFIPWSVIGRSYGSSVFHVLRSLCTIWKIGVFVKLLVFQSVSWPYFFSRCFQSFKGHFVVSLSMSGTPSTLLLETSDLPLSSLLTYSFFVVISSAFCGQINIFIQDLSHLLLCVLGPSRIRH